MQHRSVLLIDVPTQIRDVKALWVIPSSFSYPKSLVKSIVDMLKMVTRQVAQ